MGFFTHFAAMAFGIYVAQNFELKRMSCDMRRKVEQMNGGEVHMKELHQKLDEFLKQYKKEQNKGNLDMDVNSVM